MWLPAYAKSHDNLIGSLAHELNSFVSLGTDRNTLLSLLTCSLPFFTWLYFLAVSAWFVTALLSLGSRLGSPPRHFYGGALIKIMGGELLFACSALLR